ncbi:hypothetical protein SRHO_G00274880 [Serrasalmus rhombeus]
MKCDIWRRALRRSSPGQSAGAASRLMNRQQPIHSLDGVKQRLACQDSEQQEVRALVEKGGRRTTYSVWPFVTIWNLLRESEKAATVIRSARFLFSSSVPSSSSHRAYCCSILPVPNCVTSMEDASGGVHWRNRRQVGNASVHLRLLLRPPRPLPAEKEEKGGSGAATGL